MIKQRWNAMNKYKKRCFAVALATAVVSTSFNIGSFAANAGTSARGRVIVGYEELPEEIADQKLPIGSTKDDISFPKDLEVVLYSEEEEETEERSEEPSEGVRKLDDEGETEKGSEPSEEASETVSIETGGETPAESTTEEAAPEKSNEGSEETPGNSEPAPESGAGEEGSASEEGGSSEDSAAPEEGSGSNSGESSEKESGSHEKEGGEGGESHEGGSARNGAAGLVSAAADGIRNTFVPVRAYAAESEEGEEKKSEDESGDRENESSEEENKEEKSEDQGAEEPSDGGSSEEIVIIPLDEDNKEASEGESQEETTEEMTEESTGETSEESTEEASEEPSEEEPERVKKLADGERRILKDVRWKLDRNRSEYGSRFQAVRAGDVFYFLPDIKEFGLKSDVDLPEIKVTIVNEDGSVSGNSISDNSVSEDGVSENSVSEDAYPEFDQFMIVGGVKVRVTAPEGVFPEGAVLKVRKIDDAESNAKIEQAVKADMGLSDEAIVNGGKPEGSAEDSEARRDEEDGSSTPSGETLNYISFDITITDVSGNEIQPNTEYGDANVTFSQVDIVSDYLARPGEETDGKLKEGSEAGNDGSEDDEDGSEDSVNDEKKSGSEDEAAKKTLRVYHFDEDLGNMEKLESSLDEGESAVAVDAEHFSVYTIGVGDTGVREVKFTITDKIPTGKIKIESLGLTYDSFQKTDTSPVYVKTETTASVEAQSGDGKTLSANNIYYIVSENFYGSSKDLYSEVTKGSLSFSQYSDTNKIKTVKNKANYIYVKISDGGDYYLSSPKIVHDETKPVVSINKAEIIGEIAEVKLEGKDENSGINKYYVLAVEKLNPEAITAEKVKQRGVASSSPSLDVPGLTASPREYYFYAVAEDKAGNLSDPVKQEGYIPPGKIRATITVMGHSYSVLQGREEIEGSAATPQEITITASGNSGIRKIEYAIADKFYTADDDLKGLKWSTYYEKSKPYTLKNKLNFIYARVTTDGGTATQPEYVYVSSKGIWDDETAPQTTKVDASHDGSTANVIVTGKDGESGVKTYYVIAKEAGETAPSANEIVKQGRSSKDGTFSLTGLEPKEKYVFYAVTEDMAGNLSAVKGGGEGLDSTGTIEVDKFTYKKFQGSDVIEGTYYKEPKKITVTTKGGTGAVRIQYYITNKFFSSTKELEDDAEPKTVKTVTGDESKTETTVEKNKWSEYDRNSKPSLKKNMVNYIYVKLSDAAGNTEYLSSKGIWEDEIAPKVSSIKTTPKDTSSEAEVKGTDKESGIKYYYLMAKKADESAPDKKDDVKSSGKRSEDGKYKIEGLSASTKYTLYAVIEDKAGNLSDIKKGSLTTKKASKTDQKSGGKSGAGAGAGAGSGGNGSNVDKRTKGAAEASSDDSAKGDPIRDGVPYIEDATDGILIGREKTSGWDRIEGEVGKAAAPAQVFVNMNGGTEVPADAFAQCKDRDVTYYFLMNDEITWTVNGLSFTTDPKNIDFRVRTDTKNIPSKLVNEVADVYPHTNLTLEHNGDFGFTAILSINVGADNAGMFANLYYYDEDKNSLEFQESVPVDGSGRATFDFLHASDYTVIIRGDALTDKTAAMLTADTSITGDGGNSGGGGPVNVSKLSGRLWLIIVSIISFLLCAVILFMPDQKRRYRRVRT